MINALLPMDRMVYGIIICGLCNLRRKELLHNQTQFLFSISFMRGTIGQVDNKENILKFYFNFLFDPKYIFCLHLADKRLSNLPQPKCTLKDIYP